MKDTEIQFDAEALIGAVEDVRDHVKGRRKITLRTSEVALPEAPAELSPDEIAQARKALNVSQPVFARLLNVQTGTAVSWEKGRRKPSGPALKLLHIARLHPEALLERKSHETIFSQGIRKC